MISKALIVGAYHKKLVAMAGEGIEIDLVIPQRWGRSTPEITSAEEYKIHLLPCRLSGRNHFHAYSGLANVVWATAPDLIHIDEESYSIVTFQAMRLAVSGNIPALFFNWQNIRKRFPAPFSWIENYNMAHAAAGLAGNAEARDVLRAKGCTCPIEVIPQFGVDPQDYAREDAAALKQQLFKTHNVNVVGYGGRLVPEKGVHHLIDAFSRLPENCRLLLVGDGPERETLVGLISQLKLDDRVVFVPNVPSRDVRAYLSCMDCLVLPSITRPNWKEQFGRILIEAMACEVPVIGSDSGEIPNVIGDAGIVFKEGEVDELYRHMQVVLTDEILNANLRRRGLERVQKHFTQQHIARQTRAFYDSVLGR